jgi:hypothetical protein
VRLKALGKPLLKVPHVRDVEDDIEFMQVDTRINARQLNYLNAMEDKRHKIFKLGDFNDNDGTYKGPTPLVVNPLNIAVVNSGL